MACPDRNPAPASASFRGGQDLRAAFDLDEHPLSFRHGGENLVKGGDPGAAPWFALPGTDIKPAKLGERRFGHLPGLTCRPSGVGVVDADDFPVPGQMKIPLDAVGALLPGEVERGEGVLRRIARGAAVGDQRGRGESGARRRQLPGMKLGCQVVTHAARTPCLQRFECQKAAAPGAGLPSMLGRIFEVGLALQGSVHLSGSALLDRRLQLDGGRFLGGGAQQEDQGNGRQRDPHHQAEVLQIGQRGGLATCARSSAPSGSSAAS